MSGSSPAFWGPDRDSTPWIAVVLNATAFWRSDQRPALQSGSCNIPQNVRGLSHVTRWNQTRILDTGIGAAPFAFDLSAMPHDSQRCRSFTSVNPPFFIGRHNLFSAYLPCYPGAKILAEQDAIQKSKEPRCTAVYIQGRPPTPRRSRLPIFQQLSRKGSRPGPRAWQADKAS